MATSRRNEIGVGLLMAIALALLGYMAVSVGAIGGPQRTVTVVAVLDNVAGLSEGAVVAVAGVQVGKVASIEVDFNKAKLGLALDAAAELRQDVQLSIRARSLLGEKFVELAPISRDAPLLQDGDVIASTQSAVELDQMIRQLGPVFAELDPEQLGKVIDALAQAIDADPQRPERILADTEVLMHNLAVASAELPGTVADARSTLSTVRRAADQAGPMMSRVDRTVQAVETRVDAVPPEQIPGLLTDLDAAVSDGRTLLAALNGNTQRLETVLANLEEIDKWELRRLLREEGILVRLRRKEVKEE